MHHQLSVLAGFRSWVTAVLIAAAPLQPAYADDLTVFAAASLKTALDDVVVAWRHQGGDAVAVSYGSSATLAQQIRQGAPADVLISANSQWMDTLEQAGLLRAESRRDLLGNSLVLVAHEPVADIGMLGANSDLRALLGSGKLAVGLVDSVPAGIYAKAALQSLGLWQQVEPHLAQTDNVRAALALVAQGEAPLGIVYLTDARAESSVHVIGRFPDASHGAIVYPVAVIEESRSAAAQSFADFLSGPEATSVFAAQGFIPLAAKRP
jgi:molybdate transport system substrate-binding protein